MKQHGEGDEKRGGAKEGTKTGPQKKGRFKRSKWNSKLAQNGKKKSEGEKEGGWQRR